MTLQNPAPWTHIDTMFRDNCQRYAQQCAIVDGKTQLSYRALEQRVNTCAQQMQSNGVTSGDRIAIWAPNSWQWIVSAFASWRLGAVVVPISSRLKAREVLPVLNQANVRLLFTVSSCAGMPLVSQLQTFATSEKIGLPPIHLFDADTNNATSIHFSNADVNNLNTEYRVNTDDELCEILFTSGTTGAPKGVMLNHTQVLQAYWDWSDLGGLTHDDTFLVIPPFSHGFGINAGIIACVMRGMTHIVVDVFDADKVLMQIAAHKVSVMSGPPALFSALASEVGSTQHSMNSLRVAYVGAAHVPQETITAMQNTLGINRVINAFGLIEACVVAMTRATDSIATISQTVGQPLPNVEVKICNDAGHTQGRNESGEICVQSYGVMQGYYQNPEASRLAFTAEGWLRTGDMGSINNEGQLVINGRKKEMYICNGFNVYPAEVEDLLLQHDNVAQAAVVGIDDAVKGETGIAFVVSNDTNQIKQLSDHLQQWCKDNIASYKCPKHVFLIEALPLNANGKVQKYLLQKQANLILQETE